MACIRGLRKTFSGLRERAISRAQAGVGSSGSRVGCLHGKTGTERDWPQTGAAYVRQAFRRVGEITPAISGIRMKSPNSQRAVHTGGLASAQKQAPGRVLSSNSTPRPELVPQ